jgi:hypothetical protein
VVVGIGLVVGAGGAVRVSSPALASGQMVAYQGLHPLSPHQGAFCYIDVAHVHRVPPPDMRVYAVRKDKERSYVFVGDPVALGYDGPKVGYFGPHLLSVPGLPPGERMFCYISGAHYHAVAPGDPAAFVLKDGVYWYKGDAPPIDRARAWVNEVHPIQGYAPPKVALAAAPPGYHPFTVTDQPTPAPVVPVANGGAADAKGGAKPSGAAARAAAKNGGKSSVAKGAGAVPKPGAVKPAIAKPADTAGPQPGAPIGGGR